MCKDTQNIFCYSKGMYLSPKRKCFDVILKNPVRPSALGKEKCLTLNTKKMNI